MLVHPGKKIQEELTLRSRTQKQFSLYLGKKISEVNELIKGKRNITVHWDLLFSHILGTPEKYWLNLQNDYDYQIAKSEFDFSKLNIEGQDIEKEDEIFVDNQSKIDQKNDEIIEEKKIKKEENNISEKQINEDQNEDNIVESIQKNNSSSGDENLQKDKEHIFRNF